MAVKPPLTQRSMVFWSFPPQQQRVFSRSAIIDHLWDFEDPEEDIKSHIKGLTETESSRTDLIETVYGWAISLSLYLTRKVPDTGIQDGLKLGRESKLCWQWQRHGRTSKPGLTLSSS